MSAQQPIPQSPFNAIPPVVIGLFVVLMVIELSLTLAQQGFIGGAGGVGWRIAAIEDYGFSPAVWDEIMRGNWTFDLLKRLFTYAFVHGSFTHAIFAAVLFVALGKFVGEIFHPLALLAVFAFATIVGAAVYGMIVSRNIPLFGAYPAVYGLIGAYTYIMWLRLGRLGQNQLQAFRMIGFLLALQLLFGLLFGSQPTWIADVAGFVAGLGLSVLVAPGGWTSFLHRMRNR
jgi:membrane associated rhomboid family serine protease